MHFAIRSLEITASTNDDAKRAADEGAPEGTVIWALQQSAGRGRHGRQWQSPRGNLYFSVILRPKTDFTFYSFIAALAIADAVEKMILASEYDSLAFGGGDGTRERRLGSAVELKWPNDILVGGKKISGILLEAAGDALILGVGVNVASVPDNPLYPVTCLASVMSDPPSLESLLNCILPALAHGIAMMNAQGFAVLRAAWLARARRGAMRVRLPHQEITGEFLDIDEAGNLRLILPDNTLAIISAGDVFL